jgi:hypothetical protein
MNINQVIKKLEDVNTQWDSVERKVINNMDLVAHKHGDFTLYLTRDNSESTIIGGKRVGALGFQYQGIRISPEYKDKIIATEYIDDVDGYINNLQCVCEISAEDFTMYKMISELNTITSAEISGLPFFASDR